MTNCEHFRFLSSDGKTQLHACLWIPDEKIKFRAVLQIAHGVAEHIERYDDFARYLNDRGILVETGKGYLLITEIQVPGKKRMIVRDFIRGHKMELPLVLGR